MPVRTPSTPGRKIPGPNRATAASNLVAGIAGGLVVLALAAPLLGTGVINTGDTRREVIRPSFRNWDLPIRHQIFSGIRCARDDR